MFLKLFKNEFFLYLNTIISMIISPNIDYRLEEAHNYLKYKVHGKVQRLFIFFKSLVS